MSSLCKNCYDRITEIIIQVIKYFKYFKVVISSETTEMQETEEMYLQSNLRALNKYICIFLIHCAFPLSITNLTTFFFPLGMQ